MKWFWRWSGQLALMGSLNAARMPADVLAEHSALGARNTQLGVQRERPSLYDLVEQMKALTVLCADGRRALACLLPGLLMKQTIRSSALLVVPNCGHAINIDDPDDTRESACLPHGIALEPAPFARRCSWSQRSVSTLAPPIAWWRC
jgi:hypothetical protein